MNITKWYYRKINKNHKHRIEVHTRKTPTLMGDRNYSKDFCVLCERYLGETRLGNY